MSIASTVKNAGTLGQLALVAGGIYVAYRAYQGIAGMPSVTETANKAWWKTSFGDLTEGTIKMSNWGDSWEYNGPSATLEDVQKHYENGGFSTL
ncbi:hypothetical protein [Chromohalobacter moromii]|uniref:Uncharacterized protein n=1 Tax=Chromohalobacter moromii TaxID=2860329 RepID=A0A9X2X4X7_9GAMM|nr:hypothetical protein [Chromohalobacter moromii]MCK2047006.1 hypothetical protein [Chromohalobacter moromii]MCT8506583.1 hypothetical protein [Chromohalobacter moromii]